MAKENFLDSCVIISYALYSKKISNQVNLKCYNFVKSKPSKYLICYFVIKELERFVEKRKIMHFEILCKIKNPSYAIGTSKISQQLSRNEINKAKQLYEKLKNNSPGKITEKLILESRNLEINIERFLKSIADEKVVPIEEIDRQLVSVIRELLDNYDDCQVLASALLAQQKREPFFFVTIDKEHFNPSAYKFIEEEPRLKNYKFPELKNLLYE